MPLNIDNYEPYFEKIAQIHNQLHETLLKIDFVKKETKQFCLQCNYTEYVEEDHDKEYEWTHFCFDNNENLDFAVGINKLRFENKKDEINKLKETIQNLWLENASTPVKSLGLINDVSSLKKEPYEMIVSVHYWFDMALIDDGINDSQYLKIVYFGNTLNNILEKLK